MGYSAFVLLEALKASMKKDAQNSLRKRNARITSHMSSTNTTTLNQLTSEETRNHCPAILTASPLLMCWFMSSTVKAQSDPGFICTFPGSSVRNRSPRGYRLSLRVHFPSNEYGREKRRGTRKGRGRAVGGGWHVGMPVFPNVALACASHDHVCRRKIRTFLRERNETIVRSQFHIQRVVTV